MKDESNLPVTEQSLIFRLQQQAEQRRNFPGRRTIQGGVTDRVADLLEEAADEIEAVRALRHELQGVLEDLNHGQFDAVCRETLQRVIDRMAGSK